MRFGPNLIKRPTLHVPNKPAGPSKRKSEASGKDVLIGAAVLIGIVAAGVSAATQGVQHADRSTVVAQAPAASSSSQELPEDNTVAPLRCGVDLDCSRPERVLPGMIPAPPVAPKVAKAAVAKAAAPKAAKGGSARASSPKAASGKQGASKAPQRSTTTSTTTRTSTSKSGTVTTSTTHSVTKKG